MRRIVHARAEHLCSRMTVLMTGRLCSCVRIQPGRCQLMAAMLRITSIVTVRFFDRGCAWHYACSAQEEL